MNREGVDRNLLKAFRYFKLAGDEGHVESQFSIAKCYKNGQGVERNLDEAFRYFKLAADQGLAYAVQIAKS